MQLWKISYISVATAADDIVDGTVLAICASSERQNAAAGITGILTYRAGRFAQIIEGPEAALRALMARITADPRHRDLRLIADGPIATRRYADWSMAYRDPKDFVRDQLDDMLQETSVMAEAMRSRLH